MNAYELIEELEERHLQGCIYQDAANMLRQQADRIAELEKQLNLHKNAHHKCVEILQEKQSEPIAWVCDAFNVDFEEQGWARIHPTKEKVAFIPLYTTPQTKPLSDEEILSPAKDMYVRIEYSDDNIHIAYEFSPEELLTYVRAIEAKVRGE
jgi:hypothetical protein